MQHDAPEYIQVKYYTACKSEEIKESSKCDELMIGEEVEFKVEIKVLQCPDNRSDWKQMFRISPFGIKEAIHINLEMNCDCSCEHQEHHVSNTYCVLKFAMKGRVTVFFITLL
jgi:protocadherin alpha